MVGEHVLRVAHGSEVVDAGPFLDQVHIVEQGGDLRIIERQLQSLQAGPQLRLQRSAHACASVMATAALAAKSRKLPFFR